MLVGVVGKANVGKSTFFKAATLAEVEIANYPFATIKPNSGVGYVKVDCVDKEFNVECKPREGFCVENKRFLPVQMIDVAGLVPGAHKGLGMGNQFLDDLRQADVLIHVVDVAGTTNEKGEPVEAGSYDPANDIKFLEEELDYWYQGILKKGWERFAKQVVQEKCDIEKALGKQLSGLKVTEEMIKEVIAKLSLNKEKPDLWTDDDLLKLATELRERTKPMIIACNKIDINGAVDNFTRLENEFPDHMLVACSSESELALREAAKNKLIDYIPGEKDFKVIGDGKLSDKQKKALEFIKANILDRFESTGVQGVLDKAVFELLKYMAVYPVANSHLEDKDGNVLPDCYLAPPGTTALEFAYMLHTDFGDKFIRAIDLKTKMTVGKEHLLKHRDVVEIISGK